MKTLIFTGGHHTSALAVALELRQRGYSIIWLGHRHSMPGDTRDSGEYIDVTTAGFEFIDFQAGKFYRTYHPKKLLKLVLGFIRAYDLLSRLQRKHDISGIVSFGGYLAVPVVITGFLRHIPSITHEQTVESGWANRVIGTVAKKIAISWPSSQAYFPAKKCELTGLPLRPEIIKILHEPAMTHKKPILYITGGKQGSHAINTCIFSVLSELTQKYQVIHQTGTSSVYDDEAKAKTLQQDNYIPFGYSSSQAIAALRDADIVVSRSGAHICYELSVLRKRSVLIPIPWSSHQEQLKNAQFLASQNSAIIVKQSNLSSQTLVSAISHASNLQPKESQLPLNGLEKMVTLIERQFK